MDRRVALKNLTMSIGYAVAAPTLLQILNACSSDVDSGWTPVFLSSEEKHIVSHLIDVIIPKTNTVGALDVNVPQFLDIMYDEIERESSQKLFKSGAKVFASLFTEKYGVQAIDAEKPAIYELLEVYFNLTEKEEQTIFSEQRKSIHKVSRADMDRYSLYKFLISVRYYALFGYYTSEKVGEEVLNYDPIPGHYEGCVPLDEIGNVWSL